MTDRNNLPSETRLTVKAALMMADAAVEDGDLYKQALKVLAERVRKLEPIPSEIAKMKQDRSILRRCWYCGKHLTLPYFRTVDKNEQKLRVHKSCVSAAEMLINIQGAASGGYQPIGCAGNPNPPPRSL